MRTTVGIIGAGPAGLLLARLLHNAGIDSVVLESRDRAYVERRQRAGILEQGTVDVLRGAGAGERMDREGLRHDGIELRFDRRRHRVDFPALTGGRSVMVYAQTEVCKDLIALQLEEGGPLLFETEALAVEGADTDRPRVRFRREGAEDVLECDYVVGCDGFWGVARSAVPDGRTFERTYPFSWLGILADVAPSHDELVYARHDRGFALLSMRSPSVSRLYLQVPADTDADSWSDEEIWDELERRFETDDWSLRRGPITQKSVTPMRSYVHEPMRHGRLFLAGDAAHIVPPTGAKGLNLAVGDVVTFARALAHRTATGSDDLLDAYSATCLRRVWQAERFSYDMTTLLHTAPDATPFEGRLQLARLDRIASSGAAETDLAEAYTGFPIG
ncbi:4-hydroxybenzoate 3-monooxygenase [Streptomyces anthocyanicus]|uniref:4-hydroxybenzoate 3-monooxygenase n=1 Tax=Streptomyces anthocyanicus TaxID=68174 RepID=UPI0036BE7EAB